MRIAVVGGTGVAGRHVVDEARRRGHEAVALSRSVGIDAATGAGLLAALEGHDVVVDVANAPGLRRRVAVDYFAASARQLQSAAAACGIGHIVVLSIVGCDLVRSLGYYEAKALQERRHLDGAVAATIVRATQFHEFAAGSAMLAAGHRRGVVVVPRLLVQTVAARAVGAVLVDVALGPAHRGRGPDVAGPPPPTWLPERSRALAAAQGRHVTVFGAPVPGTAGRVIADGALLPGPDASIVGDTFEAWLEGPDAAGTARG